jgi:hypothetical protein
VVFLHPKLSFAICLCLQYPLLSVHGLSCSVLLHISLLSLGLPLLRVPSGSHSKIFSGNLFLAFSLHVQTIVAVFLQLGLFLKCSSPLHKGDKNPQQAILRMESKSGGTYKQKYFARPNLSFPSPVPPACYQITLLVGLSEFWWSFPLSTSFHHGSPCSYITWGVNNRPVGGRSSETLSDTIHIVINVTSLNMEPSSSLMK